MSSLRHHSEVVDASQIHIGNSSHESNKMKRPGFCCDIGAPCSVIRKKELRRILQKLRKRKLPIQKSNRRFRFADTTFGSFGTAELPFQTPPGSPLVFVTLDIVPADIPALIGLDVFDSETLIVDTVTNRLWKRVVTSRGGEKLEYVDIWHITLVRHEDHVYIAMVS
eukprot:IDg23424t1